MRKRNSTAVYQRPVELVCVKHSEDGNCQIHEIWKKLQNSEMPTSINFNSTDRIEGDSFRETLFFMENGSYSKWAWTYSNFCVLGPIGKIGGADDSQKCIAGRVKVFRSRNSIFGGGKHSIPTLGWCPFMMMINMIILGIDIVEIAVNARLELCEFMMVEETFQDVCGFMFWLSIIDLYHLKSLICLSA